jgi:hypothetical protein
MYKLTKIGIRGLARKTWSFPFREYDRISGVKVAKAICLGQLIGSKNVKEKTELIMLKYKLIRKYSFFSSVTALAYLTCQ